MIRKLTLPTAIALLAALALAGCSPRYMITQDLDRSLDAGQAVCVGEILDEMPAETEAGDRPTAENLEKFRYYIAEELSKRDHLPLQVLHEGGEEFESDARPSSGGAWEFGVEEEEPEAVPAASPDRSDLECRYEVAGGVLGYKEGSGFLRFMVGFGAGSGKILTHLELRDLASGETIYGGNFEGTVTSWAESGSEMLRTVARDFAKELEKQFRARGEEEADAGE
jgi:hypothetical protein